MFFSSKYASLTIALICVASSSQAITNGKYKKIPGVVLLDSLRGRCSGTIVGVKPLTVLSAAHCIDRIDHSGIRLVPEELKKSGSDFRVDLLDETYKTWPQPTRIIVDESFSKDPIVALRLRLTSEYIEIFLELVDGYRILSPEKLAFDLECKQAATTQLSAPALKKISQDAAAILEKLENGKKDYTELMQLDQTLDALEKLQGFEGYLDLAVLIFGDDHRFDGMNLRELIHDFQVFRISNRSIQNHQEVGMAGFGLHSLEEASTRLRNNLPPPNAQAACPTTQSSRQSPMEGAPAGMVSFSWNRILSIKEGDKKLIYSLGLPRTVALKENAGNFGGILQGDSGGPLFLADGLGVAGVNISIGGLNQRYASPFYHGWPQNSDGSYSGIINVSLNLEYPPASDLLKEATRQGAQILYQGQPLP